jgi:hypothetical protein
MEARGRYEQGVVGGGWRAVTGETLCGRYSRSPETSADFRYRHRDYSRLTLRWGKL